MLCNLLAPLTSVKRRPLTHQNWELVYGQDVGMVGIELEFALIKGAPRTHLETLSFAISKLTFNESGFTGNENPGSLNRKPSTTDCCSLEHCEARNANCIHEAIVAWDKDDI